MDTKWGRTIVAVLVALSFLAAGQAFAGADDLAKQADKIIRNAEKMMYSGKNAEADALLNEAAALIEQGKAEDPNNKKILQTEKKFTRIRTNVDKKLGKTESSASPSAQKLPPKPQSKAMSSKSSAPAAAATASSRGQAPLRGEKEAEGHRPAYGPGRTLCRQGRQKRGIQTPAGRESFLRKLKRTTAVNSTRPNLTIAAAKNRFNELSGKVEEQGAAESKAKADEAGRQSRSGTTVRGVGGQVPRLSLLHMDRRATTQPKQCLYRAHPNPRSLPTPRNATRHSRLFMRSTKKRIFPTARPGSWKIWPTGKHPFA